MVAESLAAMLRAGRAVVSRHQAEINNPNVGDKGLTGAKVLAEASARLQGNDRCRPRQRRSIDADTGGLLRAQMDSIVEVVDANQATINKKGLAFKGFIPRRSAGWSTRRSAGAPAMRRRSRSLRRPISSAISRRAPIAWEQQVITENFLQPSWPKGKDFSAVADSKGRQAFRMAVPEYYAASCLSCHGGPKGDIDVTGYPKEGGAEGDLGGVISISLYR